MASAPVPEPKWKLFQTEFQSWSAFQAQETIAVINIWTRICDNIRMMTQTQVDELMKIRSDSKVWNLKFKRVLRAVMRDTTGLVCAMTDDGEEDDSDKSYGKEKISAAMQAAFEMFVNEKKRFSGAEAESFTSAQRRFWSVSSKRPGTESQLNHLLTPHVPPTSHPLR